MTPFKGEYLEKLSNEFPKWVQDKLEITQIFHLAYSKKFAKRCLSVCIVTNLIEYLQNQYRVLIWDPYRIDSWKKIEVKNLMLGHL